MNGLGYSARQFRTKDVCLAELKQSANRQYIKVNNRTTECLTLTVNGRYQAYLRSSLRGDNTFEGEFG